MRRGSIILVGLILAAVAGFCDLRADCEGQSGPEQLLPSGGEIDGWVKDGEMLSFLPDNLWEYINGQAESFLMYDFCKVVAQHYLDRTGLEIKVEIYEHASPLMVFGIYSQLRSPESDYFDIGAEAFGDIYSMNFWKDRFYIKVNAYEEGEASSAALENFARLIAGRIENNPGEPVEISLFPPEGLVEKTITYITGGVLGTGKLPPAFAADYLFGEDGGNLYLFGLATSEEADALFDWYTVEIGAHISEYDEGERSFSVGRGEAPYRGNILIFRFGRWAGILAGFDAEAGNDDALYKRTVRLISNLEYPAKE